MKKIIPFCLVLIIGLTGHVAAQNQGQEKIDSLLRQLPKTKEDTNKVNRLVDLSFSFYSINPDKGIDYGKQGLALAEKLNWKKGIASAYRQIAVNLMARAEYPKALDMYIKALEMFEELGDDLGTARVLGNIGLLSCYQSDYPKALDYNLKALKIHERLNDKTGIARDLGNIGNVYSAQNENSKTLEYYLKALKIYEELRDKTGIADNLGNIGSVYCDGFKDYPKALNYFAKSLKIYEELGDKNETGITLICFAVAYKGQSDYNKSLEYYLKALRLCEESGEKSQKAGILGGIGEVYLAIATDSNKIPLNKLFSGQKTQALIQARIFTDSAISIMKEIGDLNALFGSYNRLSYIQSLLGDHKAALESYKLYSSVKDSVFNLEKDKKITQKAMQYEFDKKETANRTEQDKKDVRQRNIRNSVIAGLAGALIFLVVVSRQRNKISKEKKRSEELLLNILPAETAEELKATGTTKARDFSEVTVLFTDFKNFTSMSEKLSAQELVNEINYCYSAFDNIITGYGIEKIKTIGDSYMCAGGLPVANNTNAEDTVRAAIGIRDFMEKEKQKHIAANLPYLEIRIGCHTGPVVAGIVGIKKFAYDIWGDTVNIASRMESSGETGKVNISGCTYELIKDKFNCTHRGKIEAKNKGMIDMYFVES